MATAAASTLPGLRDPAAAAAATHHLLLGHGLATAALRDLLPDGSPIGITLDLHPVQVLGDVRSDALDRARQISDADMNGLYLTPVLHGSYPAHARAELLPPDALVADGDLQTISHADRLPRRELLLQRLPAGRRPGRPAPEREPCPLRRSRRGRVPAPSGSSARRWAGWSTPAACTTC